MDDNVKIAEVAAKKYCSTPDFQESLEALASHLLDELIFNEGTKAYAAFKEKHGVRFPPGGEDLEMEFGMTFSFKVQDIMRRAIIQKIKEY